MGEVFSTEKAINGLKGMEKMGEIGLGLINPSCKKGKAQFERAEMEDWAVEELLEEGEFGGPRPVKPENYGVERRASLENSFNKPECSKRAHGRPSGSYFIWIPFKDSSRRNMRVLAL